MEVGLSHVVVPRAPREVTQPASPPPPEAPAPIEAEPPPPDPLETPALYDEAGNALGQTKDRPQSDSTALARRMELLWQAIVEDRPELALPAFFPMVAYEQVKAIAKPAADWKARLVRAFERNVHEYHQRLGAHAGDAELIGLSVPEDRVRWMKPHSEGNKLGYFRVLRSQLRYRTGDGIERTLEVTSLISWRGEWFVVHLHGFK